MTAMLIDTHCHLDCEPLAGQLDALLNEARAVGIERWVVPGIWPEHWQRVDDLCRQVAGAMPAFGIHPQASAAAGEDELAQLERLTGRAVAIGEIGLDRACPDMARQESLFREQLRVARRHDLPVLIHCRGAIGRLVAILKEEHADQVGGIMHAFSGSLESAQDCIRQGFAISIAATVTYRGAVRPLQLARELPLEWLVLETDAPDLTPQRYRGCFNRPVWLGEIASKLADLRGLGLDEVAAATTTTAGRILHLAI